MKKVNIFSISTIACLLGVVGITTYDTSPVTHESCKVTGTHREGGGKTSVKYYIETENCDTLWAKKEIATNVEPGKSYDFIGAGIFTWEKVITGMRPREDGAGRTHRSEKVGSPLSTSSE